MKNNWLIIFFIILPGLFNSCELEENPMGIMSPEGFFKTASDVEAAVNGAYAEWVTTNIEKSYLLGIMLRSDMVDIGDRSTEAARLAVNDFNMEPSNAIVGDAWKRMFSCIAAANMAIKGARLIDVEEKEKQELEAKARFIRAFTYFHLVRTFGDVPLTDYPIESEKEMALVGRTSTDQIYQFIVEDLLYAKENLGDRNSANMRSIGTRGSAATVLADVYLTLKDYAKAAQEARFVISNASVFNYKLEKNYQDLFNANLAPVLTEPVFTIDYSDMLTQGAYNSPDGMVNLTRVRDYAARSLSVAVPSLKVYDTWDSRDYRKKVSFEDSLVIDGVKTALTDTKYRVPRPHIAKYFRYPGPQNSGDDRSKDHHYCLYRYAEVLLIAAEAIVETEGVTAEAVGYVNQIRERARFNGSEYTDFPEDLSLTISKDAFVQAIRDERRLEFAFEFNRWFDIKRWQILEEVFTGSNSLESHPNINAERDYLFPLPLAECDITGFANNPHY
jgi:hypothetical protein